MTQAAVMPEWMRERLAGTQAQPGEVEVCPDEVTPVSLFMSLATQWRHHGMTGLPIGLDYAAIPAVAAMSGTSMTPALFRELRLMESAALDAYAERISK